MKKGHEGDSYQPRDGTRLESKLIQFNRNDRINNRTAHKLCDEDQDPMQFLRIVCFIDFWRDYLFAIDLRREAGCKRKQAAGQSDGEMLDYGSGRNKHLLQSKPMKAFVLGHSRFWFNSGSLRYVLER